MKYTMKKNPYIQQSDYMKFVGQIKDDKYISNANYINFVEEEFKELIEAKRFNYTLHNLCSFLTFGIIKRKQQKEDILDAICDILVCVMGTAIECNIGCYQVKQKFYTEDTITEDEVQDIFMKWNSCKTKKEQTESLQRIWNFAIATGFNYGFSANTLLLALQEVFKNNKERVLTGKDGKVKLQPKFFKDGSVNPKAGKVMKKDIKPNFKQFL